MSQYDDIIHLNRPESKHKHLSNDSRAAQFAPFAALTGYEDAIIETARLTDKKIEIDDDTRNMLNSKLNYLNNHKNDNAEITISYFINDNKKEGGEYISKTGKIKRIDPVNEFIIFEDKTKVYMEDILNITGEVFKE